MAYKRREGMKTRLGGSIAGALALAAAPIVAEDAAPPPLARAHAHNDYEHARPLLDALDHGFSSVEADIYLVDGKLLVGHNPADLRPEKTLEALYLDPLSRRVSENGGKVYRNGTYFLLLIDIKSDAEKTYAALRKVLASYTKMLTVVRDGHETKNAVTIVLSGERPRATLAAEKERAAGLDGRLEDLYSKESPHLIPLISDNWTNLFKWRGEGPIPAEEKQKLEQIVKEAHKEGRGVRFWSTPDKPAVWSALFDAGVDLINTDDLKGLEKFLRERPNGIPPK
jgi:hypothetical protein